MLNLMTEDLEKDSTFVYFFRRVVIDFLIKKRVAAEFKTEKLNMNKL